MEGSPRCSTRNCNEAAEAEQATGLSLGGDDPQPNSLDCDALRRQSATVALFLGLLAASASDAWFVVRKPILFWSRPARSSATLGFLGVGEDTRRDGVYVAQHRLPGVPLGAAGQRLFEQKCV